MADPKKEWAAPEGVGACKDCPECDGGRLRVGAGICSTCAGRGGV